MFLFDVLHLLNEFHVFTSPIKTFISMGVIFILSEVLCWHVAWSVKCICLFQPSRNSIKTLRTSNETTKLWWNRYYIYFVNKNSNESDSNIRWTFAYQKTTYHTLNGLFISGYDDLEAKMKFWPIRSQLLSMLKTSFL